MRKIFNFDNFNESTIVESTKMNTYKNNISACGCLLYKIENGKINLLLIKYTDPKWPRLDDLGGQIDIKDNSIDEAINREMSEETNGILCFDKLRSLYKENCKSFYNRKSKYYFYAICVDNNFQNDTKVFGNLETHENIARTIGWYDYNSNKEMLAYRLFCCEDLINYFESIQNNSNI